MTLATNWIAVGLSNSVEPGTSTSAMVDGRELVVWRDSAGVAHIWDDRCPHRGMRMSFGFVRGDRIACLYHGWQYDTAGQCRAIPAHPDLDVPQTIRVQTHPTIEMAGMIWVCLSADALTPPKIDAGEVTPVRSVYIDRPLVDVAEALRSVAIPAIDGSDPATVIADLAQTIWLLTSGADRLLIAGQVVDAGRSALHVVILDPLTASARVHQSHFARWAEAFRDDLEREGAAA